MIYSYESVIQKIKELNWEIISVPSKFSMNQKITCQNVDGYIFMLSPPNIMKHTIKSNPKIVNKTNPFSIQNINTYLSKKKCAFVCVSEKYINEDKELLFKCTRCGEIVKSKWVNVNKNDTKNRFPVLCPNCDGKTESIHALVLKQVFLYYYPDTELEECSCRNPLTNRIMPTDIVNHRLKIAIEIQSQWHDFENQKIKDAIKKDFWIDQGYAFYDPDIRNYSVLELCQLFFNINEIPEFINYEYSNKLNIKVIQEDLNNGLSVKDIAQKREINIHRIYDALHNKKLFYPPNYQRADQSPVVQMDLQGNIIAQYCSIAQASQNTGIPSGNIASTLKLRKHCSGGYIWFYKKDYYEGCFKEVNSPYLKFYNTVSQYDLNDNLIKTFNSIFEAAKELGVNNYSIYRVASGQRKTIKGYKYKLI